jgi:hypothetical protein
MKKKGRRNDIPDFSPKRQPGQVPASGVQPPRGPTAPVPPVRVIKPHSTSAKSGRRGQ